MTVQASYERAVRVTEKALSMKRYIVTLEGVTFGQWVWARNKKEARQNIAAYARCIGSKIIKIEEV